MGAKTLEQLDHQNQQLRDVHKDLHETDETLKQSDRKLDTIKSWGGMIKVHHTKKNIPTFFFSFFLFVFNNHILFDLCLFVWLTF